MFDLSDILEKMRFVTNRAIGAIYLRYVCESLLNRSQALVK